MYGFKQYVNPKPEQIAFWNSRARFIALPCGRGSGKTDMAKHKLAKAMLTKHAACERPLFLYGLPTYSQAVRTVWDDFLKILPPETIKAVNGSGLYIETIFNSRLYIAGMSNPARVEGVQYCGAVIDEMSDEPPGVVPLSVFPALSHYRGFCYCIGVPKRHGVGASFYKRICDEWSKDTTGNYACYHWTSEGIVPEEHLEASRKTLDEKSYREQYLASWENASGLVYYAYDERENIFDEKEYHPFLPLMIGSDFNVSPMSWVICQETNGTLLVIDELSISNTNTLETLDKLYQKYGNHRGGFQFYGDAAGRQNHTSASSSDYIQIRNDKRFADSTGRVHIYYPKANPAIRDRVACVNSMLCNAQGNRRLKIWRGCKELILDLENIAYREYSTEIEKADPNRTHMSDALGYLIYQRWPLQVERRPGRSSIVTESWK